MLWVEATLEQLHDCDYHNIDWDNLLAEVESMGRRERSSLCSDLAILLLHLLKWEFQPEYPTGSWQGSIFEHRTRILRILKDSPSLRNYLPMSLDWAYPRSRKQACRATNLPLHWFPVECPYTIEDVLDDDFWPGIEP